MKKSHPAWVCGLKQNEMPVIVSVNPVTPCVGVWIETCSSAILISFSVSHPAWVCGLKHTKLPLVTTSHRHTLRGCVD